MKLSEETKNKIKFDNKPLKLEEENSVSSLRRYINTVFRMPRISEEEQEKLWKEGTDEARDRIAECYLPLVIGMVSKRIKSLTRYRDNDMILDLISAGNLGLVKAVRRFDPATGNKFITYAVYWVRAEIDAQIAAARKGAGLPTSSIQKTNEDESDGSMWWDKETAAGLIRLDFPDGKAREYADESELTPNENLNRSELEEIVRKELWEKLNAKERFIIEAYYGLGDFKDHPKMSGTAIGIALAEKGWYDHPITRQAVEQIKKRAELKLREDPKLSALL